MRGFDYSKNFKTIMKQAEKYVGSNYVDQVIDPLYVVEKAMHHFFMLAESRKEIGGKLEEVNQLYERAAHLAALAAPYRHPRDCVRAFSQSPALDADERV